MKSSLYARNLRFRNLTDNVPLDVLIVGGGMTGAPLYHELCQRGYRVALIDKGDFSSGTSQASGMLVWGGLLYLKNLDLPTVFKLCRARRDLIRGFPNEISVLDLRYLLSPSCRRHPATMWLILHLYWLMGGCALRRPSMMHSTPRLKHPALGYQEAMLRESDSRFVIDRIRAFDSEHCLPVNHCGLAAAAFDKGNGCWRVDLQDGLTGEGRSTSTRMIINCAGVWTDEVNRLMGVDSPYKHVFSKGVYVTFPNHEGQSEAHVYPMDDRDDVMTHVPWGPVMMWGPTETTVHNLESGLTPDRDDLGFLLAQANKSLPRKVGAEDVVSMRCGIRPLVVRRGYSRDVYPLDLSRRHQVVEHREGRSVSLYGGKLTSSLKEAHHVADLIGKRMTPRLPRPSAYCPHPERQPHPDLGCAFVTAEWARDHEFCVTLDDYLRRRTSIAQWTPRMGLGRNGCGRESLLKLAGTFSAEPDEAAAMVENYEHSVRTGYDPLFKI